MLLAVWTKIDLSLANTHSGNFVKSFFILMFFSLQVLAVEQPNKVSWDQYLRNSVVLKDEVDRFLRGGGWAQFDPELGYVLNNSLMPWGIDGSSTIETVEKNGARKTIMYADRPVRINTYGDSITESEQVNDG